MTHQAQSSQAQSSQAQSSQAELDPAKHQSDGPTAWQARAATALPPWSLKRQLQQRQPVIGLFLGSASGDVAEAAVAGGYDFVVLDLEHGLVTPAGLPDLLRAVTAAGGRTCTPLVRLPGHDPVLAMRALDCGAAGIMVPAASDAVAAAAMVDACRYPPKGRRGVAVGAVRASGFGADKDGYLERLADELVVVLQIETRAGVTAIADLAGLDGVDCLFIGPNDLAADCGHFGDMQAPTAVALRERAQAQILASGTALGGFRPAGMDVGAMLAAGYRMVMESVDLALLRRAAADEVERFRGAVRRQEGFASADRTAGAKGRGGDG